MIFSFLTNHFFQDGIVLQAIEQVVAGGVTYFTSVGDDGNNAWDAPNGFVGSGKFDGSGGEYHRFSTNRNGQPIITQSIGLPNENRDYYFSFQWDEPSLSSIGIGSRNDLDFFFLRNGKVLASGIDFNVGYDPIEAIYFNPIIFSSSDKMVFIDMVIKLYEGPALKYMKVIAHYTNMTFGFGSSTYSTVSGHALSASGISVGVANTPAFGKSGPIVESFSSRGGTPTLFDKFGARQTNQFRLQPVVTGPDGVSISFSLPYNSENLFIGTAASAAHVAGVAALLLQAKGGRKSLSPFDIAIILRGSAIDMDDPKTASFDKGFDYRSGHGFVDALAALNTANCYVTWNLYNSQTDKIHSKLVYGKTIDNPPLCTRMNIEAVVPCGRANGKPVLIELFKNRGTEIFRKSTDTTAKYFLFGNKGTDVYDGRIPPGTYTIRANVNGAYTPKTTFTLRGGRCK